MTSVLPTAAATRKFHSSSTDSMRGVKIHPTIYQFHHGEHAQKRSPLSPASTPAEVSHQMSKSCTLLVKTDKSVLQTVADLESAVTGAGFQVLKEWDLRTKMDEKNIPFADDLRVLEVYHESIAAKLMRANMMLANVMPLRITVFTDKHNTQATQISIVLPNKSAALLELCDDPEIQEELAKLASMLCGIIEKAAFGPSPRPATFYMTPAELHRKLSLSSLQTHFA